MEKATAWGNQQDLHSLLDSQRHVWTTWGLKQKVVHLIYTMVVRPIVTYAATVVAWGQIQNKHGQT
jgi:hypothetical protein